MYTALMILISAGKDGLVSPAVVDNLLREAGSVLILAILSIAIVSTWSAIKS
jgi:hypothetical protein